MPRMQLLRLLSLRATSLFIPTHRSVMMSTMILMMSLTRRITNDYQEDTWEGHASLVGEVAEALGRPPACLLAAVTILLIFLLSYHHHILILVILGMPVLSDIDDGDW